MIAANDKTNAAAVKEIKSALRQVYAMLRSCLSAGAHSACMMIQPYRDNEDIYKNGNSNALVTAKVMYSVFVTKALGQTPSQMEAHKRKLEDDFRNVKQKQGQSVASYVSEYIALQKECINGGGRSISLLTNQMQFNNGLLKVYNEYKNRYEGGLLDWPATMQKTYDAADAFKVPKQDKPDAPPTNQGAVGQYGKALITGDRGAGGGRGKPGKPDKTGKPDKEFSPHQTAIWKRRNAGKDIMDRKLAARIAAGNATQDTLLCFACHGNHTHMYCRASLTERDAIAAEITKACGVELPPQPSELSGRGREDKRKRSEHRVVVTNYSETDPDFAGEFSDDAYSVDGMILVTRDDQSDNGHSFEDIYKEYNNIQGSNPATTRAHTSSVNDIPSDTNLCGKRLQGADAPLVPLSVGIPTSPAAAASPPDPAAACHTRAAMSAPMYTRAAMSVPRAAASPALNTRAAMSVPMSPAAAESPPESNSTSLSPQQHQYERRSYYDAPSDSDQEDDNVRALRRSTGVALKRNAPPASLRENRAAGASIIKPTTPPRTATRKTANVKPTLRLTGGGGAVAYTNPTLPTR